MSKFRYSGDQTGSSATYVTVLPTGNVEGIGSDDGVLKITAANDSSGVGDEVGGGNGGGSGDDEFLIDKIHFYCIPVIVLLGTIGNLLSLAVFCCTKLHRLSSSYYLTALSVSDTGFLLNLFAVWLELVGVTAYNRPGLCQLVTYVSHVCCFLSPWLVVTFTLERFVATCYPLKRAAVCTVSRTKAILTGLTLTAATSYSYIFVVAGFQGDGVAAVIEGSNATLAIDAGNDTNQEEEEATVASTTATVPFTCGLQFAYLHAMHILNSLDTVVTLAIPVALIIGLNIQISRAVWRFEQVRQRMALTDQMKAAGNSSCRGSSRSFCRRTRSSAQNSVSTTSASCGSQKGGSSRHRSSISHGHNHPHGRYQIKITKMLLMISSVFVGLNAPSYVMRLWLFFAADNNIIFDERNQHTFYNLQQWFQLSFYLNFAINFLLYCVSGQNFRKNLALLVWRVIGRSRGKGGRHKRPLSQRINTATLVTAGGNESMVMANAPAPLGLQANATAVTTTTTTCHPCSMISFKTKCASSERTSQL